ncbi:UbiA family prenyltransferase [Streptomyces sp. NPDC001770]
MTRIYLSNINVWPVVMGWYAADPSGRPALWHLIALCGYVAFAGGALFIVNDILDADGDATTAPYLPLPAKLLTTRQSWSWAGVYLVAGLLCLALASGSALRLATGLGITVAGVVASMAYSKVKEDGIIASLMMTVPQTLPGVIAWLLAGRGPVWQLLLVIAYCMCACVSNNILAALRDVDLDGEVGNLTLAVRMGGPAAFRLASGIAFAGLVPVVALAVLVEDGWWALPFAAVAAALMASCRRRTLRHFETPGRGRVQRMKDMKQFKFGEYVRHAAVAAAFAPVAATVAGVVMYASLYFGHRLYTRRLIQGGIRSALDRLAASGAGGVLAAGHPTDLGRGSTP